MGNFSQYRCKDNTFFVNTQIFYIFCVNSLHRIED